MRFESFTVRIQQLESEKVQLAAESDILLSRVTEANGLRIGAEETRQWKSTLQAIEENQQLLQQEVENLTSTLNSFRHTTCKSVNELLNRLKFGLDLCK